MRISDWSSDVCSSDLTKHIAFQHGPDGIRCNTVRPGEVWTAMVDRMCDSEEAVARLRAERASRSVLPSDGAAWDIARAVAFLARHEASWITGLDLSVERRAPLNPPNPQCRRPHRHTNAHRH